MPLMIDRYSNYHLLALTLKLVWIVICSSVMPKFNIPSYQMAKSETKYLLYK